MIKLLINDTPKWILNKFSSSHSNIIILMMLMVFIAMVVSKSLFMLVWDVRAFKAYKNILESIVKY